MIRSIARIVVPIGMDRLGVSGQRSTRHAQSDHGVESADDDAIHFS